MTRAQAGVKSDVLQLLIGRDAQSRYLVRQNLAQFRLSFEARITPRPIRAYGVTDKDWDIFEVFYQ